MSRRKNPEDQVILLLLLFSIHVITIDAGASSPLKNLVNLYTHSPSESLSNITSLNQFQNEYQYRPSASKPTSSDRNKPSATSIPPEPTSVLGDHLSNDMRDPSGLDYSYQDVRAMNNVPDCKGRLKLNGTRGYITDGPGYYQTNLQCVWLIDSGQDNATIRIQVHQFNTECNYDFLYIFDGDSIYSPLVAALSGDMKDFSSAFVDSRLENMISSTTNLTNSLENQTSNQPIVPKMESAIVPATNSETRPFELKTNSGKAFIYFHSDTAQTMPGFYLTYNVNTCPLDCSNKGDCDYSNLKCRCNTGYYGEGCQHLQCPNNCTSPAHGKCLKEESCVCNKGFHGPDCSKLDEVQSWMQLIDYNSIVPARAFHQAITVNQTMWVIGGKTQSFSNTNIGIFRHKTTQMMSSFDLVSKSWTDFKLEGTTNVDHLAELSGHSVASHGDKIFIYGGMALNNSILDVLTVFDTRTKSLAILRNAGKAKTSEDELVAPVAAVGHSANIVDGNMFVFLGYNPVYGYLNFVQKFNIASNSWSILERRGSSISGCIGHTSTFDPASRLIYIFGGHNAYRSNKLYSFDPQTERWTFLRPAPSPRYYHSAAILDRQLIIFGGNSYNTSHQSDQCFHQTFLVYDLAYSDESNENLSGDLNMTDCSKECWKSIENQEPGVLKRHGHSIATHSREIILFGGFNGVLMNDLHLLNISNCKDITREAECMKPKLAIKCLWNSSQGKCEPRTSSSQTEIGCNRDPVLGCSSSVKSLQIACESRDSCTDCLSTSLGCVWCGTLFQCQYSQCKVHTIDPVTEFESCRKDESLTPSDTYHNSTSIDKSPKAHTTRNTTSWGSEFDAEVDCKVDNCYLCHSKPQCSWQNDACLYNPPNIMTSPVAGYPRANIEEPNDVYGSSSNSSSFKSLGAPASRGSMLLPDPFKKAFLDALTSRLMHASPFHSCDVPCYMRRSCNECTTTKCIWCSTSEQCIDSSAYFAYHAMGQCMHYVAHMLKCPIASCADIETCDKCLTNPKCGWLNDISNTGKGRCIEGNSSGPSLSNSILSIEMSNSTLNAPSTLSNWYYTTCPSCQCNGHSFCAPNSNVCIQSCLDNTEGSHCDRCIPGYFGDPINGGTCRPCRCNGHAQTCNRETGKCYCSTKGIIGHNCNRCDDKNYYLGDPSSPNNGTCYYNLTTDYQYTFNMSRPEDHFYSDISFVNVPLRKDSDVDFTIACSRLALVNITAGTSYKNRRPIHTNLECGSFRLRFPQDRHGLSDTNYSFFVHVYKFQTPFVLQIAFSQHRTLYLPQFFFTFSSCFLFFFTLSGIVWKLKHEYDLYVRRQRQYIEMEQMASRPFSTILLEIAKPSEETRYSDQSPKPTAEPTPISFEPCFGSNVGVLSLFVQLPGRPNLAIGSALVSLNDEGGSSHDDESFSKRPEKGHTSTKNI